MQELVQDFLKTAACYNDFIYRLEHCRRKFGSTEMYPSEIHTLVFIAGHTESNFSEIAAGMDISKGALTKTTDKLIGKDLLTKTVRPGNRKSIYFTLTGKGSDAVQSHEEFHKKIKVEFPREYRIFLEKNKNEIKRFLFICCEAIGKLNKKLGVVKE